jgi:dihydroneopterin aldolase
MKTNKTGIIELEEMEFYAHHGCTKEEQIAGNKFSVNVKIETNIALPAKSDNINDAIDYVNIYEIVKKEIEKTSHLLENVTARIIDRIFERFPKIKCAEVKVTKVNPPIEGMIKKVSLTIKR